MSTVNLDSLFEFESVDLDTLLDGLDSVLTQLVDPDGIAYQNIPILDQSMVDLLGSGSVSFIEGLQQAIDH